MRASAEASGLSNQDLFRAFRQAECRNGTFSAPVASDFALPSTPMAALKRKGDLAELKVATDLLERGCRIAFPHGEDSDYDMIADTGDRLHRVQAKYTESDGRVITVRCQSHSLTNGKIRRTKLYTAATIDWIAVYDRTSDRCYYVAASELGNGMRELSLRLAETRNGQRRRVRFAVDYEDFPESRISKLATAVVEPAGFEPATSSVQGKRSSS
jgi:hypothetical protein